MSAPGIRTYRFDRPDQWQRCLLHRFDVKSDGSLAAVVPLSLRAERKSGSGPVSTIAVGPHGTPLWYLDPACRGGGLVVWDEFTGEADPFQIDGTLAASPRWIVDRDWLWAFERHPALVRRHDRETLQLDLTVALDDIWDAFADEDHRPALSILDIAGDGNGGVWLLAYSAEDVGWLVQIDCGGRLRQRYRTPCEAGPIIQVGCVARGQSLALLDKDGAWLWLIKAADGTTRRALRLGNLAPCWSASRLATDTWNRMALGGGQPGTAGERWSLIRLDGSGDLLDGPFDTLFGNGSKTPQDLTPRDIAVNGDTIWFAMADGVWRLVPGDQAGSREAESILLTPALQSPPTATHRGWLRAEISIDLPPGAVLQAEYRSTENGNTALQMIAIANDSSMTTRSRQESIWSSLDPPATPPLLITGPTTPAKPIPVPLFQSQHRWLWLRLSILTPPGAVPPPLTGMRILYPDISLVQYLPSIFRGEANDPGGVLRQLVGVLETSAQGIDEKIRGIGGNIDPATAPEDWLDYLGQWFDLPWDDALSADAKRCLLRNAGDLLQWRGTRTGLERLLHCLLGPQGTVSITDLTVERQPLRLGGGGQRGRPLPALLAGVSPSVAVLGGKAVLGRAKLACGAGDCDPLRAISPTLQILLGATRETRLRIKPLLPGILAQFVPIGVKPVIGWRTLVDLPAALDGEGGEILDAHGPGALGSDSVIGRTVLGGRHRGRISETGLDMGFRL